MKIRFITPVQHDARVYQVGENADLPKAAAEQLIDCGAAERPGASSEKADADASAEAEAARLAGEAAA